MREVYQLGPVFDSGIFHSDPMDGQGSSLFLYKSGLSILLPLTVPVPHYRYPTTGTHPSLEYRICHSAGKLSLFGKRSSVSDPYRIRFIGTDSDPAKNLKTDPDTYCVSVPDPVFLYPV